MRTVRALLAIPVVVAFVAACSGSDDTQATTTSPSAVATTSIPAGTTAPATAEPTTTVPDEPDTEVMEGPAQIDVVVGVDSGPDRVVRVRAGADLTLNITNPDADDEYHVHVIDLERAVDAGTMATFNFNVGEPGTIEVESHETGDVIVVIEVV